MLATLSTKTLRKVRLMCEDPKPRSHLDTLSPLSPGVLGLVCFSPSLLPPHSSQPPSPALNACSSVLTLLPNPSVPFQDPEHKVIFFSKHKADRVTAPLPLPSPEGVLKDLPRPCLLCSHLTPFSLALSTAVLLVSIRSLGALLPPTWEPVYLFSLILHHPSRGEPPLILQLLCNRPDRLRFLGHRSLQNHAYFLLENISPCIITSFSLF